MEWILMELYILKYIVNLCQRVQFTGKNNQNNNLGQVGCVLIQHI